MANGVSALRLVEPAPAPSSELEKIGVAVADATIPISAGVIEWMNGKITADTKALGGERIANLYWLSQSPGFNFAVARQEGRRVLIERLGQDAHAPSIDLLVDGVLEILTNVTAVMRATAN